MPLLGLLPFPPPNQQSRHVDCVLYLYHFMILTTDYYIIYINQFLIKSMFKFLGRLKNTGDIDFS